MDTCCGFSNIHGSVLSCEVDECTPRLSGLRGAARLNGREGVILRVDAGNSARAVVRLADGEEVSAHRININRFHLTRLTSRCLSHQLLYSNYRA